jgi:hypothetical protein
MAGTSRQGLRGWGPTAPTRDRVQGVAHARQDVREAIDKFGAETCLRSCLSVPNASGPLVASAPTIDGPRLRGQAVSEERISEPMR